MSGKLILWVAIFLWGCTQQRSAGAPPQPALQPFTERVQAYVELHRKLEKQLPRLKGKAEPEQIVAHKQALAQALRASRSGARPGDIFVAAVQPWFTQVVRAEVRGARGAAARGTIMEENPKKPGAPAAVKIAVNAVYPDSAPLSTVPPALLLKLPTLPDELEYRFVGRALILRDVNANLIVDYLPDVLPPS